MRWSCNAVGQRAHVRVLATARTVCAGHAPDARSLGHASPPGQSVASKSAALVVQTVPRGVCVATRRMGVPHRPSACRRIPEQSLLCLDLVSFPVLCQYAQLCAGTQRSMPARCLRPCRRPQADRFEQNNTTTTPDDPSEAASCDAA